jgi:GNAT superfamily N-acetyltransferase
MRREYSHLPAVEMPFYAHPTMQPLMRTLSRIIRRQCLVTIEIRLPAESAAEATPPPGVVVRRATPHDSAALAPLIVGLPPESRLAQGQIGLVAELNGQIAGCIWFSRGPVYLSSKLTGRPRSHEVYSYGLRVLPELRRRGVAQALVRSCWLEAARLGATVFFGHVDGRNRSAIAMWRSVGVTTREELLGLVLLNRFAVMLRHRRPGEQG